MPAKLTQEEFINKANKIHNNKYNYTLVKYAGNDVKIQIICPKHGKFEQTPHIHNKSGCKKCGYEVVSNNLALTQKEFIDRANKIHNFKYIYDKVTYKGFKTKVEIRCPIHGYFWQRPSNHLKGHKCYKCSNNHKLSLFSFIKKANKIHNDKYDYKLVEDFKGNKVKIKIICKKHGVFIQKINSHLNGNGCSKCGIELNSKRQTIPPYEIINRANKIHHNKYQYDITKYKGIFSKIRIICPKHGPFYMSATSHIHQKTECPKCGYTTSYIERLWLDTQGVEEQYRQIRIIANGKRYKVDGYKPNLNTVFEFYGDYYHGNPKVYKKQDYNAICHKTFGELYQKTKEKEINLKKAGYKLITIWESDFNKIMKDKKFER